MYDYEDHFREQNSRKGRSASICVPPPEGLGEGRQQFAQQVIYQLRAENGGESPKRNAARRSKSERLQGPKPRVKKRVQNTPIDQINSGSEVCLQGEHEQESYNPFLKRLPSTGRLLGISDSAGALIMNFDNESRSGSPTRQKRNQRPPLSIPTITGDSPRQTPSNRSPRTVRSKSYYRYPTKASENTRRSQKDLENCDDDDDAYRLRNFSLTPKGVVNRGDSFRRRRSRSGSLAPGTRFAQMEVEDPVTVDNIPSSASEDEAARQARNSYSVAMVGAVGVGKGALVNQFMTSEHVNPYEGPEGGGDSGEKNIFVLLDGEETELVFKIVTSAKAEIDRQCPPKAIMVAYSVIDKASFHKAQEELKQLENMELTRNRALILVGNKIDLARSRAVSTQDGRRLATLYHAKFIEVSVGINHNCDELLAGILAQIKLREEAGIYDECSVPTHKGGFGKGVSKVTNKAKQMLTWFFGKDEGDIACEDLLAL